MDNRIVGALCAARRRAGFRAAAIFVMGQALTACVVPGHMNVTQGTIPQNVDTNVRFRTTYYFRVFDYCWSAGADIDSNMPYRKIVPESDTLYRYRMTGKASALGNQIKFESGTLPKEQIDPFGADVTYNSDINGFLYRSREDAKRDAAAAADARRDAAESAAALQNFQRLAAMRKEMTPADMTKATEADRKQLEAIDGAMKEALQLYLGTMRAPANEALDKDVKALRAELDALVAKVAAGGPAAEALATLTKRVEELEKAKAAANFCSIGEIRRRGFQIMGPEGMRPFDQDARLIMAMHSSAKPLIDTLSEYSGRLLKPRMNPAEQLLPLARETTTIVRTERALDRQSLKLAEGGEDKPGVSQVFDAALTAFVPEAR